MNRVAANTKDLSNRPLRLSKTMSIADFLSNKWINHMLTPNGLKIKRPLVRGQLRLNQSTHNKKSNKSSKVDQPLAHFLVYF